jgi:hypothetical protein
MPIRRRGLDQANCFGGKRPFDMRGQIPLSLVIAVGEADAARLRVDVDSLY